MTIMTAICSTGQLGAAAVSTNSTKTSCIPSTMWISRFCIYAIVVKLKPKPLLFVALYGSVECVSVFVAWHPLYGSWLRDSPIVPDLFQFKYIRLREYVRVRDVIGAKQIHGRCLLKRAIYLLIFQNRVLFTVNFMSVHKQDWWWLLCWGFRVASSLSAVSINIFSSPNMFICQSTSGAKKSTFCCDFFESLAPMKGTFRESTFVDYDCCVCSRLD